MSIAKSSSLPQIKVNLNKYDDFFTKKTFSRELAMEVDQGDISDPELAQTYSLHKQTDQQNINVIQSESTIKSKVESFLTDSRKMGILDHSKHETSHRRSLTKISL